MIFRKSITAKFIAAVFVVLLAGQILGTVLFVLNERTSLLNSLEERMRRISAIAAEVSAKPLLSSDYALIDALLDEIAGDKEITAVRILDGGGNVVRERVRTGDISLESMNPVLYKKVLKQKTPIIVSGEKIGEVVIDYTARKINEEMTGDVIVISLYQGALLFGVVFLMTVLFRRNVKNPVFAINKALERITAGDLSTPVPYTGENELGGIAKGVGFLGERLSTIITRMNAATENVSLAIKKVDHTYRNVIGGITTQTNSVKEVMRSIHNATQSQAGIIDSTERLSAFSAENVASLLEMKETSEEISSNIQRLFRATEDSYSTIVQMNQASKMIAENAGSASSAVEDTSASVEEVGASIREVEEHARESSRLAEKVQEITSGGGMMSVVNAVEGMENISEEVRKSAEIIRRLGVRSGDIEKVLSVIKDVTEKTNLLSLNAAILAAQAGEYGKSFSVVADEIRALSDRTSISTREIGGIVKTIQKDIKDAVNTVDSAQEKVQEGNSLVVKVGEALREILTASIQSTEMTKAIERATEEQSLGLRQITLAVDDIRKMMSSVAESTREQDNALSYLLEGSGEVKEVAELSKRGAFEQAEGTRLISRNLELANEKINNINDAILNQKKVNNYVVEAMDKISAVGAATVRDMEDVSSSLKALADEIETLKQDIEVFRVG
ncbi:MAG: methyl-accepting chemotaxis protein [Nitrospirota bacterium]|nr:methyl-accepting chemotaxis protein [Nitrospirota bacterium]